MRKTVEKDEDLCCRCNKPVDLLEFSPMLKHEIWKIVHPDGEWIGGSEWSGDLMCLSCMEKALGRKVLESDLLLMSGVNESPHHSWWNEKFVKEHFVPGNKFPLDSEYHEWRY